MPDAGARKISGWHSSGSQIAIQFGGDQFGGHTVLSPLNGSRGLLEVDSKWPLLRYAPVIRRPGSWCCPCPTPPLLEIDGFPLSDQWPVDRFQTSKGSRLALAPFARKVQIGILELGQFKIRHIWAPRIPIHRHHNVDAIRPGGSGHRHPRE